MDETERKKQYEEQTEALYAAIGRFAVKFEHVCHVMQDGILTIFSSAGLTNQQIGQAVLAGLTADPLQKAFTAVLIETLKDRLDDTERKIINDVSKYIKELIEARNNIIHRMWFVGWASESQEDFSEVFGTKHVNTGKGLEFRPLNYTKTEFDELSKRADELSKLIGRLCGCVLVNKKLANNFVRDSEGIVRVPSGC